MKRTVFLLLLSTLILSLSVPRTQAAWPINGQALCTAANSQYVSAIVSDGAGGAIVTWQDFRNGTNRDIYARRIDATGNALWTADGVALCTAADAQESPNMVSDGAGGAIVTWHDNRSGTNTDIYARRIDATGTALWTANGVAVSTAADNQLNPTIVSDGGGGAIITWQDRRSGTNTDIYAQRIDATGNALWTPNGVALCTATGTQEFQMIVSDGAGGAIVTWGDFRAGNSDIYARRIDATGNALWAANGVALCTAANLQNNPKIASHGAGGAIVTWSDRRSGANDDIYAQRIDATGNTLWTANGVALCTAANSQYSPTIASDGAGNAIVAWYDGRSGNFDDYAQRVDATGNALWTANGVALCTVVAFQSGPIIVSDGAGGAIAAWYDERSGNSDIYAQRVSAGGLTATDVRNTPSSAELVVHNFPNPFGGATEVQLWLPAASQVEINVFDMTGRRVRHEAIGGTQGWQRMRWDGRDGGGRRLANGVYFYRVKTARETLTRKMVIAR